MVWYAHTSFVVFLFFCGWHTQYPQAASTANQKGKIPLHYAAREGRVEMVHFFLRQCPETAKITTDKGKLAVHFSAGEGHAEITSALLWQYPQSAAIPSNPKGKLPLHFCARWGYLEIAHQLLGVYPDAVRALDWEGSLPLHDAAREGQYRMSRYLIERFPVALQTTNLRGEIPLFPAVRSSNIDLVCLMIQAWPRGGRHILRNVSADDNVSSWNWEILELLLRGAVSNLHGCAVLEGREPPTVQLTDDIEPTALASPEEVERQKKKAKKARKEASRQDDQPQPPRLVEAPERWLPQAGMAAAPFFPSALPPPAVAAMPAARRNSPLLLDHNTGGDAAVPSLERYGKKHERKRSRLQLHDVECAKVAPRRVFLPLHAALESKSSSHVIRHVLKLHGGNCRQRDERGRLPLHWAVEHCHRQDAVVQLLLREDNGIFTAAAAHVRESGHPRRLPLHAAIASRADVRVVKALLRAYPDSGVERCATADRFRDKTPVAMATEFDCDLSTVYELLRVDPSFVSKQVDEASKEA